MIPTGRLALLVLLVAVACAVAAFWDASRLALHASAALLLPVAADLLLLRRRRLPTVSRPGLVVASLRRPFAVELTLGGLRGGAEVAVAWPAALGAPLAPVHCRSTGSATVQMSNVPTRRGLHAIGEVWLRLASPLGLWARRLIDRGQSNVTVWPDLRGPADDVLGRELLSEGTNSSWGARAVGSDQRGLRPFAGGDDPRHVDWKATARLGAPVVREWQPDRRRMVMVAVDAGRLMRAEHDGESKFDAALRAVGRLALAAEARGDQVGALVYADRVLRVVPPVSGGGQCERVVRALADVEPVGRESDLTRALPHLLAIGRRSLVIVISDLLDTAAADRLIGAVAQLRTRHLPVVALLRDPHLDGALQQPVALRADAYRRAAAELVAADRQLAIELLRARSVPAFDLSMRSLAFRLVQAYLDARLTARW